MDGKVPEGVEDQDEGVSPIEYGFVEREAGYYGEVGGDDGGEGRVEEAVVVVVVVGVADVEGGCCEEGRGWDGSG